ncbi:hypothetical protein BaRGS_00006973 [Batillaria attramentaria]|uniref:Uncharacterized protein n=1 Tax=Batillaria attramentaria TaxID=370345 RepID=A0ABD0LR01_9CAEN
MNRLRSPRKAVGGDTKVRLSVTPALPVPSLYLLPDCGNTRGELNPLSLCPSPQPRLLPKMRVFIHRAVGSQALDSRTTGGG